MTFKGFGKQNRSQIDKNTSMPGHTQNLKDKDNSESSQRERTDHLQWDEGIVADFSITTGCQEKRVYDNTSEAFREQNSPHTLVSLVKNCCSGMLVTITI